MKVLIFILSILVYASTYAANNRLDAPAASAQGQWHYKVHRFDKNPKNDHRHAFIEQKATILGSSRTVRLEATVTQDGGPDVSGALILNFTIAKVYHSKGFDFEYFNGPDAPVGDRKLMRITITKDGKQIVYKFSPNGFWSADMWYGFVFEVSGFTDNKKDIVRKIMDQMSQAQSIEYTITDDKHRTITATFPLTGSRHIFEELLKGL